MAVLSGWGVPGLPRRTGLPLTRIWEPLSCPALRVDGSARPLVPPISSLQGLKDTEEEGSLGTLSGSEPPTPFFFQSVDMENSPPQTLPAFWGQEKGFVLQGARPSLQSPKSAELGEQCVRLGSRLSGLPTTTKAGLGGTKAARASVELQARGPSAF